MRTRTPPSDSAPRSTAIQRVCRRSLRATVKVMVMVRLLSSRAMMDSTTLAELCRSPRYHRVSRVGPAMNTLSLPDGKAVPALGLGTWRMGEAADACRAEVAAVRPRTRDRLPGHRHRRDVWRRRRRKGRRGGPRRCAARRLHCVREEVFIVSKVYPHNASRAGTFAACDRSRKRLRPRHDRSLSASLARLHPLQETVAAFEALCKRGHIGRWGVSNFDTDDMLELWSLDGGGRLRRQPDLLLAHRARRRIPTAAVAAATPRCRRWLIRRSTRGRWRKQEARSRWRRAEASRRLSSRSHGCSRSPNMMAIPKAVREQHLLDNFAAAD